MADSGTEFVLANNTRACSRAVVHVGRHDSLVDQHPRRSPNRSSFLVTRTWWRVIQPATLWLASTQPAWRWQRAAVRRTPRASTV
jgi:hypothetical protein